MVGEGALQSWRPGAGDELGSDYPFVRNRRAPFTPARRALPMLNLALISSAGAYIDGTPAFDTSSANGDLSFREIPIEVEAIGSAVRRARLRSSGSAAGRELRNCRSRVCSSLKRMASSAS